MISLALDECRKLGINKVLLVCDKGNVVVMGRNSYDEIGHPLPNRETIVISNSKKYVGRNLHTASSVKKAIELAKGKDVYIAGGYGIYKEAIPLVDVMYITEINTNIEQGDVFFPEFNENDFDITIEEMSEDNEQFTRKIYRRKVAVKNRDFKEQRYEYYCTAVSS